MPPTRQPTERQQRLALAMYDEIAIEALERRRLLEMVRRRNLDLLVEHMAGFPRHDEEARAIGRHRAYQTRCELARALNAARP